MSNRELAQTEVLERLRKSYILALSLIALAILFEQYLGSSLTADQENDAQIINVAGRQRMLSQRIIKEELLGNSPDAELEEWRQKHDWLKEELAGDSLYGRLGALDSIVYGIPSANGADYFLTRMDEIVTDYATAAAAKVARFARIRSLITIATLIVLLLEVLFIFSPLIRFVRRQFATIVDEREAQREARAEAEKAYREKDLSLRELRLINQAIDQAVLFASLREDGTIIYLSRQFRTLLGITTNPEGNSLPALLNEEDPERYTELISGARTRPYRGEWALTKTDGEAYFLEVSIVPAKQRGLSTERFLVAYDITDYRYLQQEIDRLGRERLEGEIERGRQRSLQIVEVQEAERLRIARDLHDGIGQKLTALKFGLETLRPSPDDPEGKHLQQLRSLGREIIREVRLATFNLTPPELTDYGLVPALERMARSLSRLTEERIVVRNQGLEKRLPQEIEINLYRITQEAVNNAIKYADANYILVTVGGGARMVSITIDDDGRGFDIEGAERGGHGVAFMRERITTLGGRIFRRSEPDGGTRITLNVPI